MSDFILALDKVEVGDVGTSPSVDLGKTKGGAIFRQNASQEIELDNDQDVEPEAIVTTKINREIEVNLADCSLENLELLFNGEIGEAPNDNVVTLPEEVQDGVIKAIRLTSKVLDGVNYKIELSKARIRPEGEVTVNNDGNAVLRLMITSVASDDISASISLDNAVPDDNSKVTVTAVEGGPAGNDLEVAFVDPGAADEELSVSVVGDLITVNLATDSGSSIISTAHEVAEAINNDASARALVYAEASGDGSTVVEAHAATSLSGGVELAAPKIERVE